MQNVFGVPAYPGPIKVKQPDGTEITVLLKGDEKVHWMETLDGYTLMYDNKKNIVYATKDANGNMVASSIKVGSPSLRSSEESNFLSSIPKNLRYSKSQVAILKQIWDIPNSTTPTLRSSTKATVKVAKAVCALVQYPDKSFTKTIAEFEALMNQAGYSANGAKGSVQDFYKENSYGQLELQVTVVGMHTATHNHDYYGENQGSLVAKELAREAANYTFNLPQIKNNIADYDNDNDGFIDTFHFIFAGYGAEAGASDLTNIWAHKSSFNPVIVYEGGKKLNTYSCSPELKGNSGNNITNIGVICHELGHVFGSPDYYDTDNNESGGDYIGTGRWDLMANGSWNGDGITPAHINMFQKIKFGWVTPTTLSSETMISNFKNSAENPEAYIYTTTTANEYFVIENRQKKGFDIAIPGHGMLIYHIHANAGGNYMNASNAGHPQQVYPVCASSAYKVPIADVASYGPINSAGCPFPGSSGKTAFTDYTTPSALSWAGNNTGKAITDIAEDANGVISFSFMKSQIPVENVQATVEGKNVTVTWNALSGIPNLTKYGIYKDGVLLITISDIAQSSYTQYNVNPGTYTYCVSAIYEVSESTKTCADPVTVTGSGSTCSPIKNLTSKAKGNSVVLNWEPAFGGGWITHAGNRYTFSGYNYASYTAVVSWSVEDLKDIYGYTLEKISFYPYHSTTECTYKLEIYSGNEGQWPDTKLLEQNITTLNAKNLTEVPLNSSIKLDNTSKRLWVLITATPSVTPHYPFGRDAGPKVENRNFLKVGTEWGNIGDFNWNISAYFAIGKSGSPVVLHSNQDTNTGKSELLSKNIFVDAPLLKEQNIMIDESENNILKSSTAIVSGYKIYRDGTYVTTVTNPTYTETPPITGTHTYCISAVYDDCESEQVCTQVTTTEPISPYLPVNDFSGNTDNAARKVTLNWTKPFQGGRIGYSSLTSVGGALGRGTSNFDVAARWPSEDTKTKYGYKLTKVNFVPYSSTSGTATVCTYSVKVWIGGNSGAPGQLLVNQIVTNPQFNQWNEVVLNTPVSVDPYEELWIGINCNVTAGFPMAYDNTTAVEGKGNLITTNGIWGTASQLTSNGTNPFKYNWLIYGLLENDPSVVASPQFRAAAAIASGYNIYRNNAVIASIPDLNTTTYTDNGPLSAGNYKYDVSVIYGANESKFVTYNTVIQVATDINDASQNNTVVIYPNPVKSGNVFSVDLGNEYKDASIAIFNAMGAKIYQTKANEQITKINADLSAGIYMIRISDPDGKVVSSKLIVK